MSELVQSSVTLGAVVVGGLISFLGTAAGEKQRYRRERNSRWDQRRLDAYMEYATALKNETRIMLRMASGQKLGPKTDPLGLDEGQKLHEAAEHERSTSFEALLLLGDAGTIDAARAWQGASWDCYQYVLGGAEKAENQFLDLYKFAGEAREYFYSVARQSLEIALPASTTPLVPYDGTHRF